MLISSQTLSLSLTGRVLCKDEGYYKMRVLVIVVTFNATRWVDRCFNSIRESDIPLDAIVIDNKSTDGTAEVIREKFPEVKLIVSEKNLGFGLGNNIGLQYAIDNDYDYVYLLNQDAWIHHDTISKLIEVQNSYTEYGILSPIQLQANGEMLDSNFGKVTCGYASNPRLISDLFFNRAQKMYEVSSVMAAHWLISRECLLKVGGFSPSFPHYGEDDNYQDRTRYFGFKIGIVTEAIAIHDRGERPYSKENEIKRLYISNVLILSQLTENKKHPLLFVLLNCFRNCVKYRTVKPIEQFCLVIKNYRRIIHNRIASFGECAFLNNKRDENS